MAILTTMVMANDRLDRCERLLWDANEQIKADKIEIEDLYEEIERLVLENETIKAEKYQLETYYKNEIKKHTGLYMGGDIGFYDKYFPNIGVIFLYKFDKWGLYLSGDYGKYFDVTIGFVHKISIKK